MTADIRRRVRDYIVANFLFDNVDDMVADETSLIDSAIIDSTGVLDLICFLEDEFGIAVADSEVTRSHLDSVGGIVSFVAAKSVVMVGH